MKKTEWRGKECPPPYIIRNNGGMKQVIIYSDAREESSGQEGREKSWVSTAIIMPVGEFDYGALVSAIIDCHYSNDQMQAIVNNYLIGDGQDTFDAMQEYRRQAKTLARKIIEEVSAGNE